MRELPEPTLRRTELTCPAHSLSMMGKAAASAADEVILDPEDACADGQKVAARQTLVQALRTLDFGAKVRAFRANGPQTPLFYRDVLDVVEAAGDRLDALVLPKVDGPGDVAFADRLLSQIEMAKGWPVGRIRLEALIESARGLLAAAEIARASPRMVSLIFGIADFAGDLGMPDFDGDPAVRFYHAKSHIVVAARAAGIDAIDHVTVDFKDDARCRRDAEGARAMGFDGKWAIHPAQLPIVNAVFTPSPARVARAQEIVAAYDAAQAAGNGAFSWNGQMIDAAGLRVERRILALAARPTG